MKQIVNVKFKKMQEKICDTFSTLQISYALFAIYPIKYLYFFLCKATSISKQIIPFFKISYCNKRLIDDEHSSFVAYLLIRYILLDILSQYKSCIRIDFRLQTVCCLGPKFASCLHL